MREEEKLLAVGTGRGISIKEEKATYGS